MHGIGVRSACVLAAAACLVCLPAGAGAAERFEDLLFFRAPGAEPGFSALWQFARTVPAKDQAAGDYLIDISETGSWNTLLRESWTAAGDASQIASWPWLEVTPEGGGAFAVAAAEAGLTARFARPTEARLAPIVGAQKIGVQFHRAAVERAQLKLEGWAVHESAIDDPADAKKTERLAIWDASGRAIYFTIRDDQTLIAARVDSAGNAEMATSSGCRWTKTAGGGAGAVYPSSWMLMVPDWKWQAVLTTEGTPSVAAGRVVQQVVGTATGASGAQRLFGISDLRVR